jgi:NifB/MoaA-like Fe-S oxidoreductase
MGSSTIQPAKVTRVEPGSIAADLGFEVGDAIMAINGERPRDLIDFNFLCADEELVIEVVDGAGRSHRLELEKDFDEPLGLEFETALFDGLIQCNNHCPFCFIDQQPPGKRRSLYYKDDDYRLSFLYGSYLTLTNLTEREWERIERLRLSPLYVSVHATEAAVRSRLLKNDRAGQILEQLAWFRDRRLQIHAQVVLCPGINDGAHLERTIRDLASFYNPEGAKRQSVDFDARAAGLQARSWAIADSTNVAGHGLAIADPETNNDSTNSSEDPAKNSTDQSFSPAPETQDQGFMEEADEEFDADEDGAWGEELGEGFDGEFEDDLGEEFDEEFDSEFDESDPAPPTVTSVAIVPVGLTRFRPSEDELVPVTPAKAREVIDQVEALQAEFRQTLGSPFVWLADEWFLIGDRPLPPLEAYGDFPQIDNGVGSIRLFVDRFEAALDACSVTRVAPDRHLTWVVGNTVENAFAPLATRLSQIPGLTVTLAPLRSRYWGQDMTVTGLLTGSDLIEQLGDRDLGDGLLLPALMLKQGELCFLDDTTVAQVAARLNTPIWIASDANDAIAHCTAPDGLDHPDA